MLAPGEPTLLGDGVRVGVPSGRLEERDDMFAARFGFVHSLVKRLNVNTTCVSSRFSQILGSASWRYNRVENKRTGGGVKEICVGFWIFGFRFVIGDDVPRFCLRERGNAFQALFVEDGAEARGGGLAREDNWVKPQRGG